VWVTGEAARAVAAVRRRGMMGFMGLLDEWIAGPGV
jgi:hypothetical protein